MKLRILFLSLAILSMGASNALSYNELMVTDDNYEHYYPQWDATDYIVFQRSTSTVNKIYRVSSEYGTESLITPEAGGSHRFSPSPSPDGGKYAYLWTDNAGYSQIAITQYTGAVWDENMITTSAENHYAPKYGTDGANIAYHKKSGTFYQIFTIPTTGGTEDQVTSSSTGNCYDPSWNPTGTHLCYTRKDNTGYYQIYTVDLSTEISTQWTSSSYNHNKPVWSGIGGGAIAYYRSDGTNSHIYKISSAGGTETKLTGLDSGGTNRYDPQWVPNSYYIVYRYYDSTGYCHLYRVTSSTRAGVIRSETKLTSISEGHYGQCVSPDGRWAASYANDSATDYQQIFKVPVSATWSDTGWIRGFCHDTYLAGTQIIGDMTAKEMAAIPSSNTANTTNILPHFAVSSKWATKVYVSNPSNVSQANLTMNAYSEAGVLQGTVNQTVNPGSVWSGDVATVFGIVTSTTGWINVDSGSVPVLAYLSYQDQVSGGIAGLPYAWTGTTFAMPHFVQNSSWWTGMSIANPTASAVNATITFYGNDGTLYGSTFVPSIPAYGKYSKMIDSVNFSYLSGKSTGWYKVEASGSVATLLVFGDKTSTPNRIAALTGRSVTNGLYFSEWNVYPSNNLKTSFTVVNTTGAAISATMTIYSSSGTALDTEIKSIAANGKFQGYIDSVFSVGASTYGSLVVTTAGSVMAGMELFDFNGSSGSLYGLAAVEPQAIGYTMFLPYYDTTDNHWTLAGIMNTGSTLEYPNLVARSTTGSLASASSLGISGHGTLIGYVDSLF